MIGEVLRRGLGRSQPALNNRRIGLRSARCDRGVTHRAASVSGGSRRAVYDRSMVAFPIRSPPRGSLGVTSRVSRVSVRADEVLRNHSPCARHSRKGPHRSPSARRAASAAARGSDRSRHGFRATRQPHLPTACHYRKFDLCDRASSLQKSLQPLANDRLSLGHNAVDQFLA